MAKNPKIESIKDTYNQIGAEFSASRQYIWPDLAPFLSHVEPGFSVLDLGCGNGRLLLGLPESVTYTGLDISRTLLDAAQKAHPKHRFLEADITQKNAWQGLPRFDYIFCVAVLHHLPTRQDQLFVLKQIKKHLKPGGKILITAWNLWQPKYLRYHLDIKTKLQNPYHVYIPFQLRPRFCFAMTVSYLKSLLLASKLNLKIQKTAHNYLLFT